ncbi:MAG: hypothetical protein ACXV2J_08280, partial [Actinomycetes bacterium]
MPANTSRRPSSGPRRSSSSSPRRSSGSRGSAPRNGGQSAAREADRQLEQWFEAAAAEATVTE